MVFSAFNTLHILCAVLYKKSLSGAGATPADYIKPWLLFLSVSAGSNAHLVQNATSLHQTILYLNGRRVH